MEQGCEKKEIEFELGFAGVKEGGKMQEKRR
jgi:hypothetical protein